MASEKKAWIISVDMGYGHQRAAYPLKDIAYERIITANSDKIVTPKEKKQWQRLQAYYEGLSRFSSHPLLKYVWKAYDKFQSISPYYPFRDLSKPTLGSMLTHRLIRKNFVRSVVDYVKIKKAPIVSTFFAPALAAAHAGTKDVYCVVTDTDINRVWAPEFPKKDRIYYLTPTEHSTRRLAEYGVPKENIFFTGFPLPKENTGRDMEILRKDIGRRLPNLDPKKAYAKRHMGIVKKWLGKDYRTRSDHPLTLTFVIGGAGAQKEIGGEILKSLREKIKKHELRLNLIAGTHFEIYNYFRSLISELGLEAEYGTYVNVLCELDKRTHFEKFNQLLHTTDIIWTKPSELCFYTALGLPIIISPPIGAHEKFNEQWLTMMGTGFAQEDPRFVNEWLFEWLDDGFLAEGAWQGFTEAPKYGTYNIEAIVFSKNKKDVKLRY
ncbi:hypothetical protein COV19_03200 [Candidatus Woesearchaeota archaeon CG10_big_fil_rev_8_21_14_0_10_44_13]|nr:MAG: hypothetical protein COV19_03200 [Candidatus Woesearchaeota archaeon CG10_big_fil_rev_8_21_14_0_10_44_13]